MIPALPKPKCGHQFCAPEHCRFDNADDTDRDNAIRDLTQAAMNDEDALVSYLDSATTADLVHQLFSIFDAKGDEAEKEAIYEAKDWASNFVERVVSRNDMAIDDQIERNRDDDAADQAGRRERVEA